MKSSLIVLYVVILIGCRGPETPTTFILLRHAEKDNDGTEDPGLKPEGIERVNNLTELLLETKIDAVYSTNFKRTRETVASLATQQNLPLQLYEPFNVDDIEKMLALHKGGTVIVCGHSNNIPWTTNLLIGREEYAEYGESEYGILLIVSVVEKGQAAKVTRLNY